jgi:hypothetical protein
MSPTQTILGSASTIAMNRLLRFWFAAVCCFPAGACSQTATSPHKAQGNGEKAARGNPLGSIRSAEQLVVYSIDGREDDGGDSERSRGHGVPKAIGEFHGFPVLGKVEISDAAARREIIGALKDGMARAPAMPRPCYWPRHGLRIVANGLILEVVICFECEALQIFDGEQMRQGLINRDAKPEFDKPLRDAGVPITPGSE